MIQCFWTAPNGRAAIFLRRYVRANPQCPNMPGEYSRHDAQVQIGEGVCEMRPWKYDPKVKIWHADFSEEEPPKDDPRWPRACSCGYAFVDGDEWQLRWEPLYAGSPDGVARSLEELPIGAMWRADQHEEDYGIPAYAGRANPGNHHFRLGPEGWCVSVNTPDGEWCIDQRSTQGTFWERDPLPPDIRPGDPVRITAYPSILFPRYHGWLRNGALVPA